MAVIIEALYEEPGIDICVCVGIKEVGKHLILNPCEILLIELLKLHNNNFGQKILTLSRYKHHVRNSSRKRLIVVKSRMY